MVLFSTLVNEELATYCFIRRMPPNPSRGFGRPGSTDTDRMTYTPLQNLKVLTLFLDKSKLTPFMAYNLKQVHQCIVSSTVAFVCLGVLMCMCMVWYEIISIYMVLCVSMYVYECVRICS